MILCSSSRNSAYGRPGRSSGTVEPGGPLASKGKYFRGRSGAKPLRRQPYRDHSPDRSRRRGPPLLLGQRMEAKRSSQAGRPYPDHSDGLVMRRAVSMTPRYRHTPQALATPTRANRTQRYRLRAVQASRPLQPTQCTPPANPMSKARLIELTGTVNREITSTVISTAQTHQVTTRHYTGRAVQIPGGIAA